MNKKAQAGYVVAVFIVFIIVMFILISGFDTVDASHIGVKNKFGVLHGIMQPGMAWTGLFMHVEQYDLRMRTMKVEMAGDDSAVDKDTQAVYAKIEINYRLNPDNIEQAYSRIGRDNDLSAILNIDGIIREGFKSTTSAYAALDITKNRQEVKEKAIEMISDNFPKEYFLLENVIVSNIDFADSYMAAIQSKKDAEEIAKAKEKEVDISKFEADKIIQIARGNAESRKLAAEATAYETLTIAKSEAEALRLKSKELTPLMVQNNYLDAWNGVLPQYILGGDTNMLMQMPQVE